MTTKIEIANQALNKIGASTISSFQDGTESSHIIDQVYDYVVKDVESQGAWTSCLSRATLDKLSTTPDFGYAFEFELPTDLLRTLSVKDEHISEIDYTIEQDRLLANQNPISIRYIAHVTDPNKMSMFLVNAIVARLASEIAYKITGSASRANQMFNQYARELQTGLAKDGQQGSSQRLHNDTLIRIR